MVLLTLAYPPVVLAAVAALLWAAWLAVSRLYFIVYFWGLALLAVVVATSLILSLLQLLLRLKVAAPTGLLLRPESHPDVFRLIDRIARRLRVSPPSVVVMMPQNEAAIAYVDVETGGRTRRQHVLILGVLDVLDSNTAEFAATVCHELAHAAAWDTRAARGIVRFYAAMAAALDISDPTDDSGEHETTWALYLLHGPLLGYFYLFTLLYLYDSRLREYRADRVAAQVCGRQRTCDMLRKAHRRSRLPELDLLRLAESAVSRDDPPETVYDLYRERLAAVPRRRWEDAENQAFLEPQTVWSTHPNLADRFRRLASVDAPELPSGAPASKLFFDWRMIERECSAKVMLSAKLLTSLEDRMLDRVLRF